MPPQTEAIFMAGRAKIVAAAHLALKAHNYWAKLTKFWPGSNEKKQSATPSLWSWGAIYAKFGQDSTGGWRT
jgi:hypothetical protein